MLRFNRMEPRQRINSLCRLRPPEARLPLFIPYSQSILMIRRIRHKLNEWAEIRDIAVSAIVLALLFAYEEENLQSLYDFPSYLLIVSLGFILHELAHRFVARKYECRAEYKMWKEGILLAIVIALISNGNFLFAAPGAVVIYPRTDLWGNVRELTKKRYGLISLAGPLTNIALAGLFFAANAAAPSEIFLNGITVNIWLALFNMIPMPPLDGAKVFGWDKRIWASVFAA